MMQAVAAPRGLLDRVLELLGTNRTRMEWKLRAWRRGWERFVGRWKNRTAALTYEHKTCPGCNHPAGADETVCTRCGRALGGRTAHRARRLFGMLWASDTPIAATVLTGAIAAMYAVSSMWGVQQGLTSLAFAPHPLAFERFGSLHTLAVQQGEVWRLSTSTFLHAHIIHLAFNLFSLWTVAIYLEEAIGAKKTLALYLALGACASVTSFVWHSQTWPYVGSSVGASGAVCGLIGVTLGFALRRRNMARHVVRNYVVWAIWLGILGLFSWQIDNAAHVGGFVPGLAVGLVVRRSGETGAIASRVWTYALAALVAATIASLVIASRHTLPDEVITAVRDLRAAE